MHPIRDIVLNSLNMSQMCLSGVDSPTDMVFKIHEKAMSPDVAGQSLTVTGQCQKTGVVFNISSHALGGPVFLKISLSNQNVTRTADKSIDKSLYPPNPPPPPSHQCD